MPIWWFYNSISGNLMPISDFRGPQGHKWFTYIEQGKHIHTKKSKNWKTQVRVSQLCALQFHTFKYCALIASTFPTSLSFWLSYFSRVTHDTEKLTPFYQLLQQVSQRIPCANSLCLGLLFFLILDEKSISIFIWKINYNPDPKLWL